MIEVKAFECLARFGVRTVSASRGELKQDFEQGKYMVRVITGRRLIL